MRTLPHCFSWLLVLPLLLHLFFSFISFCLNLAIGTQERSWRLNETYNQRNGGHRKVSVSRSPTGSCFIWVPEIAPQSCLHPSLPLWCPLAHTCRYTAPLLFLPRGWHAFPHVLSICCSFCLEQSSLRKLHGMLFRLDSGVSFLVSFPWQPYLKFQTSFYIYCPLEEKKVQPKSWELGFIPQTCWGLKPGRQLLI